MYCTEALPQFVIAVLYIDTRGVPGNEVKLISAIFSAGSIVFFFLTTVFGKKIWKMGNNNFVHPI